MSQENKLDLLDVFTLFNFRRSGVEMEVDATSMVTTGRMSGGAGVAAQPFGDRRTVVRVRVNLVRGRKSGPESSQKHLWKIVGRRQVKGGNKRNSRLR